MPYVNIKVAGVLTTEQKSSIAGRVSQALEDVAGKPKSVTYVVFEEVSRENWAVGDRLLSEPAES